MSDPSSDRARSLALAVQPGTPLNHDTPVFRNLLLALQQRIFQREWLPGEQLPSIVQLSKDLRASTGSVREALRSLQSLGLVTIVHGRGVFVLGAPAEPGLAQPFEGTRGDSLLALAEARQIVEPELAALAAERATDSEIDEIARLAKRMASHVQLDALFDELDALFHRQIAHAARNPTLDRVVAHIANLLLERCAQRAIPRPNAARAARYHLLIAEALADRDAAQARLLMLAHMKDALNHVLELDAQAREVGRPRA